MSRASGPRASFGRRLAALVIDAVILTLAGGVLVVLGRPAANLLSLPLAAAYFSLGEGSRRGQTLGKSALGIRVVSFDTGASIGFGGALLRYVGRVLSGLALLVGYLWMLWDRESQTWHDKIAGSVVVPVADYPLA